MKRVLLIGGLVACGGDPIVVAPVIEGPTPGSEAAAFPDLDEVELAIARAGEAGDLLSASFRRGETLELPGVAYGDGLVVHLTGRVGGSEVAYGRTCGFDLRPGEPLPAPHLYFARTVKWAERPAPAPAVRLDAQALARADGSAVFVGGEDAAGQPLGVLDHFDPRTGTATAATAIDLRRGALAASLGDGRIVIAGGAMAGELRASPRVEVVDLDGPPGRRVDRFDDPRLARAGAAATTLSDGSVLVVGGGEVGGPPAPSPVELRVDGAAIAIRELRASLAVPRTGATVTRLSDDLGAPVLIVGGRDGAGVPVGLAELYKPLREGFADPLTYRPTLRVARAGHVAVRMPDGSVLIAGGVDAAGAPVRALELFSVDGGFVDAGTLPDGAGVLELTATALPDGRVLLAGGRARADGPPLTSAYIARLDPLDGSVDVVPTDALGTARARHAVAPLCDGTLLLVGGTGEAAPAERYDPPPAGRR